MDILLILHTFLNLAIIFPRMLGDDKVTMVLATVSDCVELIPCSTAYCKSSSIIKLVISFTLAKVLQILD